MTPLYREVWFTSGDGLKLYARDYGPSDSARTPVLCLNGLTRNSRDFEDLAPRLAADGRRVIAPDYRGRGRSAYMLDGASYRPDVELADALTLLDHLGVPRVAVIGTSRGGIIAMFMAKLAPDRLAGVLFNDIGPVLEPAGLRRIRTYLGRTEPVADWPAAIAAVKRINSGFTGVGDAQWERLARRVFADTTAGPAPAYDSHLADLFPTAEAIQEIAEVLADDMPAAKTRKRRTPAASAERAEETEPVANEKAS